MNGGHMRFDEFLASHPVFRVEELSAMWNGKPNKWTLKATLAYHRKQGHIILVRRGLYAAVPPGASPDTCPVDPYLLASKVADDAVLAYHTSLEVHGKAHSIFEWFRYLTSRDTRPLVFRSNRFEGSRPPAALRARRQEDFGVKTVERSGVPVRITSLERTLVDVLDRPDLSGGWEEIWRSLESVEFFDLAQVVEYALLLENATTASKVGYFLDQHRKALMVEDDHLEPLKSRRPKRPHYMDRSRRDKGQLVPEWNLIVPVYVANRSWEESQ
jgi:predicted transcriptional regulator of viral defense system